MQTEIQTKSGRRVAQTQLEAYYSIDASELAARKAQVMDCFTAGDVLLTREDIAARTNMKLSSVCGRVRELLDDGLLAVRGSRKDLATPDRQQLLGLPTAEQRARFEAERAAESAL